MQSEAIPPPSASVEIQRAPDVALAKRVWYTSRMDGLVECNILVALVEFLRPLYFSPGTRPISTPTSSLMEGHDEAVAEIFRTVEVPSIGLDGETTPLSFLPARCGPDGPESSDMSPLG